MKEVRLRKVHIPQAVKRLLPVVPVALGFAAVAMADHSSFVTQQSASSANSAPASSPQASPKDHGTASVTVNGRKVPVGENGAATVKLPDGGQVQVADGGNTVTTSNGPENGSGGNRNTNVQVNSNGTNNSGTNWSSTQVVGSNANANGSSMSFSNTQVFSTSSTTSESSSE